jgi:acetate kinase
MGRAAKNILVLNAGSSSIKFAVFDTDLNEKSAELPKALVAVLR